MLERKSLNGFWDNCNALVEISNPLSQEQEILRPVLMPGVAAAVAYNIRQQQEYVAVFEIAKAYQLRHGRLHENYHVCIAVSGRKSIWLEQQKRRLIDTVGFLHVKGIVCVLLDRFGVGPYKFRAIDGYRVDISTPEGQLGAMRRVAQDVLDSYDVKNRDIYLAEISLDVF